MRTDNRERRLRADRDRKIPQSRNHESTSGLLHVHVHQSNKAAADRARVISLLPLYHLRYSFIILFSLIALPMHVQQLARFTSPLRPSLALLITPILLSACTRVRYLGFFFLVFFLLLFFFLFFFFFFFFFCKGWTGTIFNARGIKKRCSICAEVPTTMQKVFTSSPGF
jgi:hypothetical protein